MYRPARSIIALAALGAALSACGSDNDEKNLASLDAQLTNNSVDPALREAVEAPIASDPDLTGEANRDAVRPSDKPLTGTMPRLSPPQAKAQALKLAGGKLMPTPAVTKTVSSTKEPVTLGGMAEQKQGGGKCAPARIDYAMQWAERMPAAFPIYPGSHLTEAAGADNSPCNIRAASFTTGVARGDVMDFYTTMAHRGGYTIEHVEENGEHVLGGTRDKDEGAYYISFRNVRGGGTAVDLIANGGR